MLENSVGKWMKGSNSAEIKSANPYAVRVAGFSTMLICLALEDMVRKWLTHHLQQLLIN